MIQMLRRPRNRIFRLFKRPFYAIYGCDSIIKNNDQGAVTVVVFNAYYTLD